MANDLTGQNIQDTYQRVLHVGDDGFMYDGTGSLYTPVSASHEITTETSSSHAISADTLGGLNTTVAELNYLDGITENNGVYVKAMNQSVATSVSTTFTQLTLTELGEDDRGTLELPPLATATRPHIKVNPLSSITPSIYLGDNGEDIITFVSEEGAIKSSIDQDGGYNGTINGGTW